MKAIKYTRIKNTRSREDQMEKVVEEFFELLDAFDDPKGRYKPFHWITEATDLIQATMTLIIDHTKEGLQYWWIKHLCKMEKRGYKERK